MKRSILFLFIALILLHCSEDTEELMICGPALCSTRATVRDITGLDACYGFVFELEDGTNLRPYMNFYCGTEPIPEEIKNDPLFNFQYVDGKQILINYELVEVDWADACMAGTPARITCLTELEPQDDTR